jgi:hypothetical protein
VTREEVQVRRVSTDRPATGSQDAFTDGDTIRVPVSAEHVAAVVIDKAGRSFTSRYILTVIPMVQGGLLSFAT